MPMKVPTAGGCAKESIVKEGLPKSLAHRKCSRDEWKFLNETSPTFCPVERRPNVAGGLSVLSGQKAEF